MRSLVTCSILLVLLVSVYVEFSNSLPLSHIDKGALLFKKKRRQSLQDISKHLILHASGTGDKHLQNQPSQQEIDAKIQTAIDELEALINTKKTSSTSNTNTQTTESAEVVNAINDLKRLVANNHDGVNNMQVMYRMFFMCTRSYVFFL